MADRTTRHRDAVRYNQVLAEAAESLLGELTDPDVRKWVTGISNLHRFHERRHLASLRKAEEKRANRTKNKTEAPMSVAEEQSRFAAEQEASA